ncbi:hypothetical protein GPECTOR_53g169 [Gonium pectorale]|uniref:Glycosyl transferase CAP10 domain-containing protein n=1 Tax=Gonium pectorale TaxID=33097 RepID=A0A150G736_GONPE|nr:hypothetical protein GPECTOR_53g169 [Gonium pectorale]|eukprot:KXZ45583.1 hypothetical protein GPECTOR_53g169 [Gonium pectorale]
MMRTGILRIYGCAVAALGGLILLWTIARQPRIQVPPDSGYTIKPVGNYYAINFTDPVPPPEPSLLASLHYGVPFRSCWRYARSIEEPMTDLYGPRTYVPSIGADAPRAIWRWPGPIYKSAFDKAANKEWPDCTHCMDIVPYKVLSGKLYVAQRARSCLHRDVAEEMLKVLLHMFPVPDMEFLLHFGDGCTNGLPVISWNICRQHPDAGFTMPSYSVWQSSMGPTQMRAYHTCLNNRWAAIGRASQGGGGGGGGGGGVHNQQATARLLLDHVGILEGFAYTLMKYKNLTTWAVEPSTEGYVEVDPQCCTFTRLPRRFAEAVTEGPSASARRLREAAAVGRKGAPAAL